MKSPESSGVTFSLVHVLSMTTILCWHCTMLSFSKAQFFLMKWCVDFNLIPAHLNDRGVIIPPAAEELSALTWNLHAENSLACQ